MSTSTRSGIDSARLREMMARHRDDAASSGFQIRLAKAGQKSKTVTVQPGTSILDAFRNAGFKVKPDQAKGKEFAVVIENLTPGQEDSWTDAARSSRVAANHHDSDFSEPVVASGFYVIATNVEAGF